MKKTWKLFVVLSLVVALMAACSSNNNSGSNMGNNAAGSGSASNQAEGGNGETALEPYELTMAIPIFGPVPPDINAVQDEINKIAQERINTKVTFLPISIGAWGQQMNLMMSSGEKLDLVFAFGAMYNGWASTGQLQPIDVLMDKHGQQILDEVGRDNIKVAQVNGKIYGVPVTGPYATQSGIAMRKDMIEKYNIDVSTIKNIEDLEPIFQLIKQNEPGMTPIASGLTSPLEFHRGFDRLGDRLGVLPGYDNGLKVVNVFETQEYADNVELMHKWFKAGYINKDAATTQSTVQEMVRADKAFSYFMAYKPDIPASESLTTGKELMVVPLGDAYTTTDDLMIGLWGIAQQSEDPERAMMMLNLIYTDSVVTNLLRWGIEGKHYVKVSDTQIDYPEGVDGNNVGYKLTGFLSGNQLNTYVFKTDDPDLWEQTKAFNESAIKSKAFGFVFNPAPVQNELTALNNVIERYRKVLETGTVGPSGKLEEFNKQLKAAGLDKVIGEKQKQLDEWAAANQ